MRFDDAAADYERVYQLAYKDPKWMEKVAEVRAREGKADVAVAALKTALVDGTPENACEIFRCRATAGIVGHVDSGAEFSRARGQRRRSRSAGLCRASVWSQTLRAYRHSSPPAGEGVCHPAKCTGGGIVGAARDQGATGQTGYGRDHGQRMARTDSAKPCSDSARGYASRSERDGQYGHGVFHPRGKSWLCQVCGNRNAPA